MAPGRDSSAFRMDRAASCSSASIEAVATAVHCAMALWVDQRSAYRSTRYAGSLVANTSAPVTIGQPFEVASESKSPADSGNSAVTQCLASRRLVVGTHRYQ